MTATQRQPVRHRVAPLALGAVAAMLYANFLLDWVGRGFVGLGTVISDLEAPGQPFAGLLRVTDVVCAVLVIAILPFTWRVLPANRWRTVAVFAMMAFAAGAAFAAVVPALCEAGRTCGQHIDPQTRWHDGASLLSDTALYVSAGAVWVTTRCHGPRWLHRFAGWDLLIGGLVSSAVFGYFTQTQSPAWAVGVSQRVHVLAMSAWIFVLAFAARRHHPNTSP